MKFSVFVLTAISMAAISVHGVPIDVRGEHAHSSSSSAGPTSVEVQTENTNNLGLGLNNLQQTADGQHPVILSGVANGLAGFPHLSSKSKSQSQGHVKTIYHNDNVLGTVPTLEEFRSQGHQRVIEQLKAETSQGSLSPEQLARVSSSLRVLTASKTATSTSSSSASKATKTGHTSHHEKHNKRPKHSNKKNGSQRSYHANHVSKARSSRNSSMRHASKHPKTTLSKQAVSPMPTVSLPSKSSVLLASISSVAQSLLKRDENVQSNVFEAV